MKKKWTSVILVCFGGASTMPDLEVYAMCKVENKNILYCYAHCLKLALVKFRVITTTHNYSTSVALAA